MIKIPVTEIPKFCALNTRNPSDEFPSVKILTMTKKVVKGFPMLRREILGAECSSLTATSFAPMTSDKTAKNPGIILINTIVWKVDLESATVFACASQTTKAAINKPIIAPALSIARLNPKASPRILSGVESATRASRGAVRTPLPMRSAQRTPATSPQLLAK